MNTKIKLLTIGLILLLTTSCSLFDSGGETIKGRYNIGWIDTRANRSINYALKDGEYGGIEKVRAFIKRLGNNDRYIIAERIYFEHSRYMDKPNYDMVSYYIIDMENESPYKDEDVFGPFDKTEFENWKAKLGIKDLEFTKEYYDN